VVFRQLQVLAPDAEVAKQRVESLLSILDQGFSRPLQIGLFKVREENCRQLRVNDEKLTTAQAQLREADVAGKKEAVFSADAISLLRVQHFQYETELAGLEAKIAACEKLLNAGVPAERQKQIEEAKTASQIELAGCEARLAKSTAFLDKVKNRDELTAQQAGAIERISKAERLRQTLVERIEKIDQEIESFGPVRILGNSVIIRPVEWVKKDEGR
jgi:hypothetical protein